MVIPPDVIWDEAQAVVDDLLRRGYSVRAERYDDDGFGNALIVLGRDRTLIRLVRDRGQWFVEVAAAEDWFSPVVWRAFLESSMPSPEIISLEVQIRWLLSHLDQVEAINRALTEEQLAGLRSSRARRAQVRQALPPMD